MMRRGLTLIEVLAATVLITLIALACLPIIQSASITLREDDADARSLDEFSQFIDQWLAEHRGAAQAAVEATSRQEAADWPPLPAESDLEQSVRSMLQWPPDVLFGAPTDKETAHAWVVFRASDITILRWFPLPPQEEGARP